MSEPTVADHIALILKRHGIDCVFGQSLPSALLLAIEKAGLRQVFYRTENAGGAMADGYARISQRVGVVAAQNGPAATLLVPPLSEALKASVPLLAFVQEVARTNRDRNAFQEMDHVSLLRPCTKWIVRLDDPRTLEHDLARAIAQATQGRPGPVALLVPKDVLMWPAVTGYQRQDELGGFPLDRPRPARSAVQQAARILAGAKRPVVVAGGGVHLSGAAAELGALQDLASLPVATTVMGKGSIDEGHPLSIGVIGHIMGRGSLTHSLTGMITGADAILLVGTRTNENGTDAWRLLPDAATYMHLDAGPEEVSRNYSSLRLVADARAGLEDLVEELQRLDLSWRTGQRAHVAQKIAEAHQKDARRAAAATMSTARPVRPERLMAELDRQLRPDDIVVADASYATIWAAAYLRSRRAGQRFLSPRGLAGLGWGLPMALGAQVARPGARVVCITGDGAFAHTWAELETAVRESLPVAILLLNNGVLGYQKHAELHEFGSHTTAVSFQPVDHVAIARACGAQAWRLDEPAEIKERLAAALAGRVPTLIEVMTDPAAYPPITAWDGSAALQDAFPVSASMMSGAGVRPTGEGL